MVTLTQRDGCDYTFEGWKALAQFLDRPFFRQIWIIQEIIATRNAMLICGESQISWKELALVITFVKGNVLERLISISHGDQIFIPVGASVLSVTDGIRHLVRNARKPTLDWNLLTCHLFDVTDARDRIFTSLNISSDAGDDSLAADYSKSVEDVFINTANHLPQKRSSSISIFYAAGIGMRRSLNELPSWVPDWTTPPGTIFGASADTAELFGKKSFKASGMQESSEQMVVFNPKLRSIKLKAQIFDVVASVASPQLSVTVHKDRSLRRENHAARLNWRTEISQLLPSNKSYPTGGSFFPDALARTLMADMKSAGDMADGSTIVNFLNFYAFQCILAENEGQQEDIPPSVTRRICVDNDGNPLSPSVIQERLGVPPYTPRAVSFSAANFSNVMSAAICTAIGVPVGQRRVYTTRDGYIGLGPPMTQKGDLIYLIYGTRVPFLIRHRSDNIYFLVGESYVHGVMFGEAIGRGKEVEITLV